MFADNYLNIYIYARLLPNKYFKEPRRAKAKKFGAQQVNMFWELLQNFKGPIGLSWVPQAAGLLLGSSLDMEESSS